jgi:hypothetical protein
MNHEFQVLFRSGYDVLAPLQALVLVAETSEEIESSLKPDYKVVSIVKIRPLVDFKKPVWDLDEFAAVMNIKGQTLSGKKGDGKIPWSTAINGVPSRVAMAWIDKTLNEAGKRILSDLMVLK